MRSLVIFIIFIGSYAQAHEINLNSAWVKSVSQCQTKDATGKVWLFKQWHLSPGVVTKGEATPPALPQAANQTAIYEQIAAIVDQGKIKTVIAEGCEGEIKEGFKTLFNGWDLKSLQEQAKAPEYAQIVAHVPLKIEAKYGNQVNTWCGDSEKLIQQQNLALSDLRGLLGYQSRIQQFQKQPEKAKAYLDSYIQVHKLNKNMKINEVLKDIQSRMKLRLTDFKNLLKQRNKTFVQAIQDHGRENVVLVIGGLHAQDLQEQLKKAQYDCEVLEPSGYAPEDEKLLNDLEKMI